MNYPDLNAMDTSRLSMKEREDHIRQERCFVCHEQEHVTWACNKRPESSKPGPSKPEAKEMKKIMNAADTHTYLRSIYNGFPNNEKQELYKHLEEEGF